MSIETTSTAATDPRAVTEPFKSAFRHHPAGVAVVAAATPEGPRGLTVSSLASVAVDPCVISFSVASSRGSAGAILAAPSFAVSMVGRANVDVALSFSIPGAPRFGPEQNWASFADGQPFLVDSPAALRCLPLHVVPVGDSSLVIAEVLEVRPGDVGEQVVYYDRAFREVGAPVTR